MKLSQKSFAWMAIFSLLATALPAPAHAADFVSSAPAATVARGQREVMVMNFSVPAYSGDTVADADGAVSEDAGVSTVQAGGVLYNISSASRLAYGVGGQTSPTSIWIDRDGSKKYTPNYGADTSVAQAEPFGIPMPDGDVGAAIKKTGMGSLKMLFSDPANVGTWHRGADALYQDVGTITNLADTGDTRIGTGGRFKQGSLLVPGKAAIVMRATGNACPAGVAAEDFISIVGKNNIAVKEVYYEHEPTSGACLGYFALYTASYSYALDDQFQMVTPYTQELDIADVKDNADNGAPDAQTTALKILSGTLKGISVGDTLRIARGASTIDYRVTELSTLGKVINVVYISGGLVGGIGEPYAAAIANHAPFSGILTGALSSLPNFIGYADDNNNNVWDTDETIYADADASTKVSKNDERITNVRAEQRLLKKNGAVDTLGGTYVDTASMAAPKWRSETDPWTLGSDIVIDLDGDGFYNLDLLKSLKVKNEGTAPTTAVSGVDLWMEDNGVAGFQGSFTQNGQTDLHVGKLTFAAGTWTVAGLGQPLIAAEQFYVTANVAANAPDSTLRFSAIANGLTTTHRTMPDGTVSNNVAQTISAAAVIPPEQQPAAPIPSPEFSIVRIADHTQALADGKEVITIEVEVRDTNNVAMPNKSVTLQRLRGAEDIVLETKQDTTNALGIATFGVTSQEAGVFRFRALSNAVTLGNATATFLPLGGEDDNSAGLVSGDLFMTVGAPTGATVYYFANGKKYPFPNERVYLSWYSDFNSVTIKRITAQAMGDLPWGTNVRYRPGTRMIKVPDDPKVYAVIPAGKVCWVKDEATAQKFYGTTWNKKIDDLLASLFVGTYRNDSACDLTVNSKFPSGTIVSFDDKQFYIDNGAKRVISRDAWIGNRFRNEFLITANNLDDYPAGAQVGVTEFAKVVE